VVQLWAYLGLTPLRIVLTDSKLKIMKNALIIGLLLLCQYGFAEEIELPAYFPFFPLTANQMIPDEGISVAGLPEQKLFLMETPAYGGNSGSPAFFRTERSIPILKVLNLLSSKSGEHDKIILAGIVEGGFLFPSEVQIPNTPLRGYTEQNADMAVIVPATYINEALFSKDEIKNRKLLSKMLMPKGYF
jgi:hypothetical protein